MNSTHARQISLQLNKRYHENYLRFVFKSPAKGPIVVTREQELGKYLFSRVRYCAPDQQTRVTGDHVIQLIMPSHGNDLSRNHYLYYTADDMARINDFIESMAYLDFRLMVQTGVVDLEMNRKTVIEIYSDMVFGEDKYEMLKKDEYRKRQRVRAFIQRAAEEFSYKSK
jgi:hypothetical protein